MPNGDKQRDTIFDIFKGIGIILMVLAHSFCPGRLFIYLFHMAIFFICSGVFFKSKYYENIHNVVKYIKSKIKHLYLPFILWGFILVLIHNFLIHINVYTNNPLFLLNKKVSFFGLVEPYSFVTIIKKLILLSLFDTSEQLAGATWFLRTLFWISVSVCLGFYILNKYIKNNKFNTLFEFIIFAIVLYAGFLCQKIGFKFYSIGTMMSCACLYYLGILYQRYKQYIPINNISFILSIITLCITYLNIAGTINLAGNKYPNPIWLIISSASGFIFLLFISKLVNKINILNNILSYIGKHTISILLFHFAAFKIITYIQVIVYSKPDYMLASFPILQNNNGWWIIYSIVGILIPLSIAYLWEKLKTKINILNK